MSQVFQLQSGGATIAGEQSGDGPALIFLHAGVADIRMWRSQMKHLEETCRVIAYDRRGFGQTAAVDEPFSHVGDLRRLYDHLGITSAVLIGCSQGGRISIDFALRFPDLVRGLVLIAPGVSGEPDFDSYEEIIQTRIDALTAAEEADDLDQINALEALFWLDGPASTEGRVSGDLRELFLDMNRIALEHPELSAETPPPSAYEHLAELAAPTLVIWGDLDFPDIRDMCRHLVSTVPGARGVEIPGVAHLPSMEQPARVNQLLEQFLPATDK